MSHLNTDSYLFQTAVDEHMARQPAAPDDWTPTFVNGQQQFERTPSVDHAAQVQAEAIRRRTTEPYVPTHARTDGPDWAERKIANRRRLQQRAI